jgi:hypothetical protein
MMKCGMIAAASMLASVSSARAAYADEAVLVTGGAATEHDRAVVSAAAEAAIRNQGWSLRAKPLAKKEADAVLDCHDSASPWTCVPASLTTTGAHHVVVITTDARQAENGAPMVVVTGKVIATDTQDSASKQRRCVQCADDKLASTAADLAQELLRDIEVREGHTVIDVRSNPSGAQIMLDGRPVQVTNASLNTYAGKHVVIIERPGFEREVREVTVARGKTAELDVALRSSVPVSKPIDMTSRSHLLPAILIVTGAVALGAGITLYALDQDPSPTGGRMYWDTAPAGVVVGAVGLATAGVGAYLWYRSSRTSGTTPTVAVAHHGAVFALSGSF